MGSSRPKFPTRIMDFFAKVVVVQAWNSRFCCSLKEVPFPLVDATMHLGKACTANEGHLIHDEKLYIPPCLLQSLLHFTLKLRLISVALVDYCRYCHVGFHELAVAAQIRTPQVWLQSALGHGPLAGLADEIP